MALIHIIEGAISGTDTWENVLKKIESLFTSEVAVAETALETFAKQFLTDFGKQALSLAATAVGDLLAGKGIKDIAAEITPQITADAISTAEKDGTVVLNALRVQLTAAAANAPVEPSAPAA